MATTNYPIKDQLAEHFLGDLQDSSNDFMTGPALLRAIAEFMESHTIRDAEFDCITFGRDFGEGDECNLNATLFYRLET